MNILCIYIHAKKETYVNFFNVIIKKSRFIDMYLFQFMIEFDSLAYS
jgi:hypothetical protein